MAGFARIWNLADPTTWTAGGSHAKPRLEFTAADLDAGDSIATIKVRIYTATSGGTHAFLATLTGSALTAALAAGYYDADYAMLNENQASSTRWLTIEAIDALGESSFGATAPDSMARTAFKVCWGQAIYEYDNNGVGISGFGSPEWAYSLTSAATTQAAFLFANADDNGANRSTPWQANISAVPNTKDFLNVLVRLSTAASGVDATLANMTFDYQSSAQQPENWVHYPTGNWALDIGGARRFGSRSYRCVISDADVHYAEPFRLDNSPADGIIVQPNTDYVFSAYVRTKDPPGPLTAGHVVRLQIANEAGTAVLAFGSLYGDSYNDGPGATLNSGILVDPLNPSSQLIYPEGWQRLHLHFRTDANTEVVRPSIVYCNADGVTTPTNNGDVFWADAAKWEEGTVVSAWSPGFISPAVVIDSWGVHLDGVQGATLTLVKSDGTQTATLDEVVAKVNEVGGTALQVFNNDAANGAYVAKIDKTGDSNARVEMGLDGSGLGVVKWGSGGTQDVALARSATRKVVLSDNNGEAATVTLDIAGQLDLKEQTAPGTPASGRYSVYPKSDGKLYGKNDAGTEHDLTSGGGGGGMTDHDHSADTTQGGDSLAPGQIILPVGTSPTIEGDARWDSSDDHLVVGTGGSQVHIPPIDSTAPTTQAFGDAAVVGTTVRAARRDHKHGMPATPVTSFAKSGSAALTGAVTLSQGSNVTLTQTGNDIQIASTGGGGGDETFAFFMGG